MTTINEITGRTAETEVFEMFEYAEPPRWIGTTEHQSEHGTYTQDDWRLSIRRKGGFSAVTMQLEYHTGSGLRRKIEATSRDTVSWWVSRNKDKLPVGYSPYGHSNGDIKRMPEFDTSVSKKNGKFAYGIPQNPSLTDVLYAIVSDTQGYDGAVGYEDWASNYGYDSDSRKGYRAWKACGEQARKFRRLLKAGDLEHLSEVFQDY